MNIHCLTVLSLGKNFILFYYQPNIHEVWHSINTCIGKCFTKNNQEFKENLEKTFGMSPIPKTKKLQECQLKRATMNNRITEACTQVSDAEKGKIELRPAIPFVPGSMV